MERADAPRSRIRHGAASRLLAGGGRLRRIWAGRPGIPVGRPARGGQARGNAAPHAIRSAGLPPVEARAAPAPSETKHKRSCVRRYNNLAFKQKMFISTA